MTTWTKIRLVGMRAAGREDVETSFSVQHDVDSEFHKWLKVLGQHRSRSFRRTLVLESWCQGWHGLLRF